MHIKADVHVHNSTLTANNCLIGNYCALQNTGLFFFLLNITYKY